MRRLSVQCASSIAIILTIAAAGCVAQLCPAANIPTLLNTGVDLQGKPLSNDGEDMNWELILIDRPAGEDPVPPDNPFVRDSTGGFPIPPWLSDAADFDDDVPSDSRWIVPSPSTNGPAADYHFEITFDLSLFDHSTAVIDGGWSTDNLGLDIIVNGTGTGQTQGGFGGWSGFDIPNNLLLPGENTIVFVVQNAPADDNPAGLRVDFATKQAETLFLAGDFNNDAMINMLDFDVMLDNFLTGTTHEQGDMNLDVRVDLTDFNLFVAAFNDFNGGGAPAGVPEPGSFALLCGAAALLAWGAWRRRDR